MAATERKDADVFQNLTSSALSTDASVTKFSRRSVQYFYAKLLTDSHIDKRRALHNLFGGGKNLFKTTATTVFRI